MTPPQSKVGQDTALWWRGGSQVLDSSRLGVRMEELPLRPYRGHSQPAMVSRLPSPPGPVELHGQFGCHGDWGDTTPGTGVAPHPATSCGSFTTQMPRVSPTLLKNSCPVDSL